MKLADRILALHLSLERADIRHAFGGALALAWCTQRARGTIDIDLNLFLEVDQADRALAALPDEIVASEADRRRIARDGQVRLWWDSTPVDLFFNTTNFHADLAARAAIQHFAGVSVPFLSCMDLAVFKAFFNRTKDWADLEEMVKAGSIDLAGAADILVEYLGDDDERIHRLRNLTSDE